MASTARLLQIRFSVGGLCLGGPCFGLYHHRQQHQRHSSSYLPKDSTTTFPSSHGTSWWRGFRSTRNPNERKENKKSGYLQEKVKTMNPSHELDFSVRFIHPDCGAQMERLVCKKSYQTGMVVSRCSGCNDYVVISNHCHRSYDDSRVVESFLTNGEQLGLGSDQTLNFVLEEKVNNNNGWYARLQAPIIALQWDIRDAAVVFTHGCGATLTRRVYKKALEEGMVVTRCTDCKQLVVLADHRGFFGLYDNAKLEKDLEEGSEKTINFTVDDSASLRGNVHALPIVA